MVVMMKKKAGIINSSISYCSKEKKPCIGWWVEKYFKDCLCNLSDEISFSFGFVSLICWGVAEIPQIITNFTTKSGHGVSLAFLLTWVAGDIFNLVGCLLEPATLPTQYYTALLYTTSTIVLVLQSVYYDYVRRWWKYSRKQNEETLPVEDEDEADYTKPLNPKPPVIGSRIPIPRAPPRPSSRRHYTSARSLASSDTPPFGSYLRIARSGPSAIENINGGGGSSSEDDDIFPHPQKKSSFTFSQPRRIPLPRPAGYAAFVATSATLPFQSKALIEKYVAFSGRTLLNEHGSSKNEVLGLTLGWLMAAIYMGGRIPQICLNIKRGSVEHSGEKHRLEGHKAKHALYIFYGVIRKRKTTGGGEDYGDYVEAEKAIKQ
ncbi:Cystinosin/ERS1p repeat [Macleaya cordata]|uniref:Cystinosin/ERS1p repeat n=1 Tax=Macleaya cordata TaxID=56857 RepID=A0A200R7H1_MACCD|nr:Cystinosin/ERS1p repeat [Macleaya cordata]